MKIKYSYVKWIQDNEIIVYCYDHNKTKILKLLKARRRIFSLKYWVINYCDDEELAKILSALRDDGFLFGYDEHGWCPSGIFEHLRDKNLLSGKFMEIYWRGTNKIGTREL